MAFILGASTIVGGAQYDWIVQPHFYFCYIPTIKVAADGYCRLIFSHLHWENILVDIFWIYCLHLSRIITENNLWRLMESNKIIFYHPHLHCTYIIIQPLLMGIHFLWMTEFKIMGCILMSGWRPFKLSHAIILNIKSSWVKWAGDTKMYEINLRQRIVEDEDDEKYCN